MPRPLTPASRSIVFSTNCQLCGSRPGAGKVANIRLCTECGTRVETIASDAGVSFLFGRDEVDALPGAPRPL